MNLQLTLDKAAIGLSLLCAAHCLILPLALLAGVSLAPIGFEGEEFHQWLLIAIIPTSIVALMMGCRKHKRHRVYVFGAIGLCLLVLAGFLGHDLLGEVGEKALTMIGVVFLALGHVSNYKLCREQDCECDCSPEPTEDTPPPQWRLH